MADNQTKYNLIEDYIADTISETDKSTVEDLLKSDPQFKKEFKFQKEVIDTLKSYRKSEMKNRLAGLPVQSSLIGSLVSNSAYFKPVLVASIAGIIGIGSYFTLYNDKSAEDFTNTVTIENIGEPSIEGAISELQIETKFSPIAEIKTKKRRAHRPAVSAIESPELEVVTEELVVTPNDIKVDIELDHEIQDETISNNSLDKEFENKSLSVKKVKELSSMEVATIDKESKSHQYKFSKGRLYLYGDFGEERYEILEINKDKSKEIILFLAGKYYELNSKYKKATPLTPINNPARIQEIELLKKIKLGQ